jgi:hypothetical protein
MAQPVVHFEIIGTDPQALRGYYGDLFGWEFDTGGEVAKEVSEPTGYGFTDPGRAGGVGGTGGVGGAGIPGGVGGGPGYPAKVLFYVGVPDVEAALGKAESLGGTRVLGPVRAPSGLVVGQFTDPEGHLVGVAGG